MKLLQINYQLESGISDFLSQSKPVADILANFPGLRWKIWLKNDDENQGGGIYLFENSEALKSFVQGPVVAKLRSHPAIADISLKEFDIPQDLSSITRAPV